MTCSSRAQIRALFSIRDSRTSSTEIESDCFFARRSHFAHISNNDKNKRQAERKQEG